MSAAPSTVWAASDADASPSPEAVDKAQALFKKGAAFYEKGQYALALAQFRASYDAVASPNSRLYIARCLADLEELIDAYVEFDKVIEEAAARAATEPRYAKTQQTAQVERDELTRKLALVTVTVSGAASAVSLQIAGRDIPRERWGKPVPALPGDTAVVLRTRSGSPVEQTVALSAGESKALALDAEASRAPVAASDAADLVGPRTDRPATDSASARAYLRPYAYISSGVGVAGFAVFTVAGLMTNSTYNELSESCGGPCPPDRQNDVDAGRTQKTIANVGLAVGVLGLAAGTTLFILSFSGGSSEPQGTATAPQLVVGPGYTSLRGVF